MPDYRTRLAGLIAAARAGGIKPVLITQPQLWGEGTNPSSGRPLEREAARLHGLKTSSAVYWRAMEMYNDTTRKLGTEFGIPVIDLVKSTPKDTSLYLDNMHFSAAGSRRVTDIVAVGLCPILASWYPDLVDVSSCPSARQ